MKKNLFIRTHNELHKTYLNHHNAQKTPVLKKCFIIFLFLLINVGLIKGQNQPTEQGSTMINIQHNSFYVELGGNASVISINYERFVPVGNKTGLGFRIGAGTAGSADTTNTAVAYTGIVEINFLYGKSRHYLETGIGFTNAFVVNDTEQWCSIKLGYRYLAKKGFLFKIAPMYIYNFEKLKGNHDVFGGLWLGASFGYSF